MAITFKVDSTTGEGTFIRVLRDGQPFGKILDATGLYRFYEGDHEKLGGAELQERGILRAAKDGDPIEVRRTVAMIVGNLRRTP
jgi:hypothetical protein